MLDNKQKRKVESKIVGYARALGKSDEEVAEFLEYSEATIRRRAESLKEHSPEISLISERRVL